LETDVLMINLGGEFMTIVQFLFYRIGTAGLAPLESSGLFFPPTDVEGAVAILRNHSEIVWLFPFLATACSVLGAAIAFGIGRKIGRNGLEQWISPGVLDSVRHKIGHKGVVALVLPALLPPPFPLLPFVLACGALSVNATRFFILFASLRLVRFSILTALAWFYGRQILAMLQTGTFKTVVAVIAVLFVAGTCAAIYRLVTMRHRFESSAQQNVSCDGTRD
jgi:membrane protein YqaA with SNARE-associated domain